MSKPNHDLFCECNHRLYQHSPFDGNKCWLCKCERFKLTENYLKTASRWELARIILMILFDDYKRNYSIIGKYAPFYTEPTRLQLASMVLHRDINRIALSHYPYGCSFLTLFSIVLNYEFVIDYLVLDNEF